MYIEVDSNWNFGEYIENTRKAKTTRESHIIAEGNSLLCAYGRASARAFCRARRVE